MVRGCTVFGLILFLALAVYITGAWMFSRGARRFYSEDQVWTLAAMWPVLLLTSSQFRRNFNRALKP
ncbi:gsr2328 [Gloeobacter violaceus PCC 7421]|uniref:Gsr2328 protein n=1 Tax=Gloeobacter violaceus (strain ATCC 29082 / PCC 7421) TaxID=251221 RepID=Q7NI56_GLOVI|nr:gsr2328 [Gloeobacter violaceus PCC 7421]